MAASTCMRTQAACQSALKLLQASLKTERQQKKDRAFPLRKYAVKA